MVLPACLADPFLPGIRRYRRDYLLGSCLPSFWWRPDCLLVSDYFDLEVLAVSLTSISIFSIMEPDKFSDGLLAMGVPDQFAFGLSYGYRMIPVFLEECHNIFNAYCLRGKGPENAGFLHWRKFVYFLELLVKAFYAMILNTAKRTRTTVEGLQIKGYTYAVNHPEVKKLKLQHLKIESQDI